MSPYLFYVEGCAQTFATFCKFCNSFVFATFSNIFCNSFPYQHPLGIWRQSCIKFIHTKVFGNSLHSLKFWALQRVQINYYNFQSDCLPLKILSEKGKKIEEKNAIHWYGNCTKINSLFIFALPHFFIPWGFFLIDNQFRILARKTGYDCDKIGKTMSSMVNMSLWKKSSFMWF